MKTITFILLSILAFYFVTINEYFTAFLILITMVLTITYQAFQLPSISGSSTVVHAHSETDIGSRIGSIFDWLGRTIGFTIRKLGDEPKTEEKKHH